MENKDDGTIIADGGVVLLTAKDSSAALNTVINNEGLLQARTILNEGGVIKLLGGMDAGTVMVGGTLDASAPGGGDGGRVETSGFRVRANSDAEVDTSAAPGEGAGEWLIRSYDLVIADEAPADDNLSFVPVGVINESLQAGNVVVEAVSSKPLGRAGDIFVDGAPGSVGRLYMH